MAKASLTLPDGTIVNVEGSADEIQKIISLHRPTTTTSVEPSISESRVTKKSKGKKHGQPNTDLSQIVNEIKNCSEVESIEINILDRTSRQNFIANLYLQQVYRSKTNINLW